MGIEPPQCLNLSEVVHLLCAVDKRLGHVRLRDDAYPHLLNVPFMRLMAHMTPSDLRSHLITSEKVPSPFLLCKL